MRKRPLNKGKTITLLFVAGSLLLLTNVILDRSPFGILKTIFVTNNYSAISADSTEKIFTDVLTQLGIEESWMKKTRGGTIRVGVPADLPIPLILAELKKSLLAKHLQISSKEERINGKTVASINSSGQGRNLKPEKKLEAVFIKVDTLYRKSASIGFILKNVENLSEREFDDLLSLPESFLLLFYPSQNSAKLIQKILSYKGVEKYYGVLLGDYESELKFKFGRNYSDHRNESSVKEILQSFGKNILYFVDDRSEFFYSGFFPFVQTSFAERGVKLIKMSTFDPFIVKKEEILQKTFKNLVLKIDPFYKQIFILDAETYLKLKDELSFFRKKGYKFLPPGMLMDNKN